MQRRSFHFKYGPLLLVKDDLEGSAMTEKISNLDRRVQGMLLWSSVFALLSYLALMFRVLNLYTIMKGSHVYLLSFNLFIIGVFFGAITYKVWKKMKDNKTVLIWPDKSYLNYQIAKLQGQRKLIIIYLELYAAIIFTATVFFYLDRHTSVSMLLRITMPVCLLMYGAGFYFIAIFTRQKKKLDHLRRRLDYIYFSETLHQN